MSVTRLVIGATLIVAIASLALAPVSGGVECDPYPIGRCGNEQRERVIFCYVLSPTGEYLSATDKHVVALGGDDGVSVDTGRKGDYYVRIRPYENFANDPSGAPLPQKTLWDETNSVQGLQTKSFKCADFIWFAECVPQQWMGPFNEVPKSSDTLIV